jgi:hypothetical protein
VYRLVEIPEEQAVLRQLLAWHHAGVSFHHMATALNERAVPTKQHGQGWTYHGIRRILRSRHLTKLAAPAATAPVAAV